RGWGACYTLSLSTNGNRPDATDKTNFASACADVGHAWTPAPVTNHLRHGEMDVLTDLLRNMRLNPTLLYQYELRRPWNLELPRLPFAVFHYLSRGAGNITLENGDSLPITAGDCVVVSEGQPHCLWSDPGLVAPSLHDIKRQPAHAGVIHHGGKQEP